MACARHSDQLALPLAPASSGERVEVWADAAVWRALRPAAREDLTNPNGGVVVAWEESAGMVRARVTPAVAAVLRGMGDAHGLNVHEGTRTAA
jgi:hypothetical protein